jgi:MoaA/NifB/PqqE/SkfB family radical SAM enzyme
MALMRANTAPRFSAIADTIDFAFFPRVPEISLELTNVCNLTCPYCANPILKRPKGTIEWDLLEHIVDQAARDDLQIDWLHGVGEPLLWKRLEDAIRLIRSRGAGAASFATNGTLLFEDRVRTLLDAGLTRIYVSIDTLDPEIYKATRGGKLSKVIENINAMIRIAPPDFLIRIALMDHRDSRLDEAERRRFTETFGAHPNVLLNGVTNTLMPSAPADYRIETGRTPSCLAPRQFLFITKDGIACLCCADQDSLHALGDVSVRSIRDIWFDPQNQTTFRNIALGVNACPSVCTEKCVLAKPQPGAKLAVPSGFALPFEDAKSVLADLLDLGDVAQATELAATLNGRDPKDQTVAGVLRMLQGLGEPVGPQPEAALTVI